MKRITSIHCIAERNCLENSYTGLEQVFLVVQSGNEGASPLVLLTSGTSKCSPCGFSKQFLEGEFSETEDGRIRKRRSGSASIQFPCYDRYKGVACVPRLSVHQVCQVGFAYCRTPCNLCYRRT